MASRTGEMALFASGDRKSHCKDQEKEQEDTSLLRKRNHSRLAPYPLLLFVFSPFPLPLHQPPQVMRHFWGARD